MAIRFRIRRAGSCLIVKARGFDESRDEVQGYGMAVVAAAREAGCPRVLCDERALDYRLGLADAQTAAQFLAEQVPEAVQVAIVCAPQHLAAGGYWATVAGAHGLPVRVFTDAAAARRWLEAVPMTE